ncbi:MAG: carbon-nitrogen hydrolase family protein [Thermoplasmataceae archaeon]
MVKVSLIQMESNGNKEINLQKSLEHLKAAMKDGAVLAVFPEYQMFLPDYSNPATTAAASESTDGNFVTAMISAAKGKVTMVLNIAEYAGTGIRPYNTSIVVNDLGIVSGKYRKLHLFDAYGHRESSCYQQGGIRPSTFSVPDARLGLQICYDLRFPEPARILRLNGASIISYQAGWFAGERKLETWRTLLRARAIENGSFVLASAQCGKDFTGHTMAVSPYGDILGELENQEGILTVDLDMSLPEKYSTDVPVIRQRRKDIYDISGF